MRSANQTQGARQEFLLALSWNIATEPQLYRKLAHNPYSDTAHKIILERFPDTNIVEVIQAVILAEPEAKYDRDFNHLSIDKQGFELEIQKKITLNSRKRLLYYCNTYSKDFSKFTKEYIYDFLSVIVFKTADKKEIEQKYSQDQRKNFRLAIFDYINDGIESSVKVSNKNSTPQHKLFKIATMTLLLFLSFFYITNINSQNKAEQNNPKNVLGVSVENERQNFPVRLRIPNIDLDISVENVGLTTQGAMDVPIVPNIAGWFKFGPLPGEKGSAVIAGHSNGELGEAGVFVNLYKLKKGDKLYIEDSSGKTTIFVVRESALYDPGYSDEVFSNNDNYHLNLITCDGVWDGVKKSYTKRLVVFADIAN